MKRALGVAVIFMLLVGGYLAWRTWRNIHGSATAFSEAEMVLLVPRGADFEQLVDSLRAGPIIRDEQLFRWVAERKKYGERIRPGRYVITKGTTMNDLVNKLRSGDQDPVNITFNNIRNLPQLAGRISRNIEADSLDVLALLRDPATAKRLGFNEATLISLFLPNTYEVWWTVTPEELIDRFAEEYKRFWNPDRLAAASALGLSQSQVSTLASIVQAETGVFSDAPTIASVYLNRLRIGMPLQADPTLLFALGLDSAQRVLNAHKEVDSPYNTYKYKGLPPGPINLPEPRYIEAVLHPAETKYLYFCAREDLSGYSNFSTTYEQHLVNARRYQQALNQRRIYR